MAELKSGSFVFFIAVFLTCYAATALHDLHMFQLNSYKMRVHVRWLLHNFITDYIPRHFVILPLLLTAWTWNFSLSIFFSACFLAVQAYHNRPKKAKKPLVYTPRVLRMLTTHAFLITFLIVLTVGFVLQLLPEKIIFLTLIFALSPLFMLLSNILNLPLEKAINFYYISDAKRILRGMPRLLVIGVTGSYGKTSTKHFLTKLLSSQFNVLMTPENYNTTMGVVKTVRADLRPTHEIFVCEMGARNPGDIKEICDLVQPRHGVITAIGPQHLESFKTLDNIVKTKFELADALPQDGLLFLNCDNEVLNKILNERFRNKNHGRPPVSYSISCESGANYAARDIRTSSSGSSFRVTFPDGDERTFETRLIGGHNVQNIMAAIAVSDSLGVDRGSMAAGVRRLEAVPHRLQLIRRNSIIIIDDAYNSNQNGAKAALETLGMFEGCKILVTPGMIELGAAEDEANRRFGEQAAAVCDFVILVGERQTRSILKGLKSAAYSDGKISVAETLGLAFEAVEKIDSGGAQKVVLLENDLPDNY